MNHQKIIFTYTFAIWMNMSKAVPITRSKLTQFFFNTNKTLKIINNSI